MYFFLRTGIRTNTNSPRQSWMFASPVEPPWLAQIVVQYNNGLLFFGGPCSVVEKCGDSHRHDRNPPPPKPPPRPRTRHPLNPSRPPVSNNRPRRFWQVRPSIGATNRDREQHLHNTKYHLFIFSRKNYCAECFPSLFDL